MYPFYFVLGLSAVALFGAWVFTTYTRKKRMEKWDQVCWDQVCDAVKKELEDLECKVSWKSQDSKDVPDAVNRESDWKNHATTTKTVKQSSKKKKPPKK